MTMNNGKINVTAENIFPIIKKFLYSDQEIFLRELISNAVDATTKLKSLATMGEAKGELGDLTIEVKIDKDNKTISIIDRGVGMTTDEVNQYINEVAFSGAEAFLKKYEGKLDGADIIGHFGLGFYSAFMVAKKVELKTKSFTQDTAEKGAYWVCEGNPEFQMGEIEKADRGTEIVLHIADDATEFLEEFRIRELLKKYARFMQVPIQFGTREEKTKISKDGEEEKFESKQVADIVNNTAPAWTKSPAELSDEDYKAFYRELYPMSFEEPLFHIHLNVDYPFNLTGILFFPRIKPNVDPQRNKIQLYQSQVFVTDSVEGIVPDFLTLLHGVIDSKDIPLNVSRSYLQADSNVKKISGHITKKVADKLEEQFKKDRADFEKKWNETKLVINYGMLTDEKFYDRAKKFYLLPGTEEDCYTLEEYEAKIKDQQTDKNGNLIFLYAAHKDGQHAYIERAAKKGYHTLLLNDPLTSHLIQKLESSNTNWRFARVDADSIDKLIEKEEEQISVLTDKQKEAVKEIVEKIVPKETYTVQIADLSSDEMPFVVTVPEFMRRMKEMSMTGGGMMGMGDLPDSYNLLINSNNPLIAKILDEKDEAKQTELIEMGTAIAKLQQNLLHGKELSQFVNRALEKMA
jgi:molecular chaperone HtpG